VAIYPKPINERFRSPSNAAADGGGTKGTSASFLCGSFIEVSVGIGPDSDLIETATFRTNGCGFMVAAADVLCDWLTEKALSEMHGLGDPDLMRAIGDELGVFPDGRYQCATVVFQALRNAMAEYRERRIEEFQGEKALICTCFGVTEETLIDAIGQNGFTEVEQVSRTCRAGSGCGSCRFLIQELIDMQNH
jgi:NifU-like protein